MPSARDVGTYDHLPQMRAREITDRAVEAIRSKRYPLIVMNYANPDMVGHTGNWDAIITGLEVVDEFYAARRRRHRNRGHHAPHRRPRQRGGKDRPFHGEELTAHTCNDVPLIAVSDPKLGGLKSGGKLADVAPSICSS